MKAVEHLTNEHREIAALLTVLNTYADALSAGKCGPRPALSPLVQALRVLADEVHFEQEEQILMPWLVRRGVDWEAEVLQHSCIEHARARYLLSVLEQAVARECPRSELDRECVVLTARALVQSQRQLMHMQHTQLYPLIEAYQLSGPVDELSIDLRRHEASLDSARVGPARHLARRLLSRRALRPRPLARAGTSYRRSPSEPPAADTAPTRAQRS
jgi:hemerythrin-like domain-containing protein